MICTKRNRPAYREKWYSNYKGETALEDQSGITDESRETGKIRRRIEDIREGLRLDRDAFGEVWEYSGVRKL